ncbi:unnamed protein product [Cuscuta campestris]|uniref:Uncharacterized protein n=1 Tax=Cuscuta campestris TaxID=132261 RepID=A0A484LG24_9ASTE|nr:unnamed protein product [Cuscuta campestris]
MRNIVTCYSDRAVRVTDSYCSPKKSAGFRSPATIPVASLKAVRCVYRADSSSSGDRFLIKITWYCRIGRLEDERDRTGVFSIGVVCNSPGSSPAERTPSSSCTHRINIAKGSRQLSIQGCDSRIGFFWDLTNASYGVGPEPVSGFCLLVSIDSEIALFLGDPGLAELEGGASGFSAVSRCEYFSGGADFSTRARFSVAGATHDVLIRCSGGAAARNSPANLSVWIDRKEVVAVQRLGWNFRGNQTIFVDGELVDMMWDAHDWMFDPRSAGRAVFLFRTRSGLDSRLWMDDEDDAQKKKKKKTGDFGSGWSFMICAAISGSVAPDPSEDGN